MSRPLFFLPFILSALTACDRPDGPGPALARQPLAQARAACIQVFQRQRACTDQFIPALVDLRRELDQPSGIREAPRGELIGAALEEWKTDSTDEAIASTCEALAAKTSSQQAAAGERCAALGRCDEFVSCALPLTHERFVSLRGRE